MHVVDFPFLHCIVLVESGIPITVILVVDYIGRKNGITVTVLIFRQFAELVPHI